MSSPSTVGRRLLTDIRARLSRRDSVCPGDTADGLFTSLRSCADPDLRNVTPVATSWCRPSRLPGGSRSRWPSSSLSPRNGSRPPRRNPGSGHRPRRRPRPMTGTRPALCDRPFRYRTRRAAQQLDVPLAYATNGVQIIEHNLAASVGCPSSRRRRWRGTSTSNSTGCRPRTPRWSGSPSTADAATLLAR